MEKLLPPKHKVTKVHKIIITIVKYFILCFGALVAERTSATKTRKFIKNITPKDTLYH